MKRNKKTAVWVIVILIILASAFLLVKNRPAINSTTDEDTTIGEPESTEDTTAGSTNSSATPTIKYGDAVVKYAATRIQLDTVCQAHPNNVTYKNGTTIMVDNRSAKTAQVHLGGTFSIKPYGFKIMKLTSATLPATLLVDCGASQNVATILIQK